MDQLVYLSSNVAFTDTRCIASAFGHPHNNVLDVYNKLIATKQFADSNFTASTFQDAVGNQRPLIIMSRAGFSILVKSFRGQKAARVKKRFAREFEQLEAKLLFEARGLPPVALRNCIDPQEQSQFIKQVAEQVSRVSASSEAIISHHSTVIKLLTGYAPASYVEAALTAGLCTKPCSAREVMRQLEPAKFACSVFLDALVSRGKTLDQLIAAGIPQAMVQAFAAMLRAGITPAELQS